MTRIIKSPAAEKDLDDIWDYIAEDNPDRAVQFLRMLEEKLDTLAQTPQIGRLREELAPKLRSFPVKNCIIFYEPLEDGIFIVRVLHTSRDIDTIFKDMIH